VRGVGERIGELLHQGAHGGAVEATAGDAEAVQGALDLAHHAGQRGPLRRAGRAGDGQQEAVRRDVLAAQVLLPPGAQAAGQVAERGRGRVHVGEGAGHGRLGGGRRGEHGELDVVGDGGRERASRAVGERVEHVTRQAEQLHPRDLEPEAGILALLGARAVVRDRDALRARGPCGPWGTPRRLRVRPGLRAIRARRWRLISLPRPDQRPPRAPLRVRLCHPTHGPSPSASPRSPPPPSGRRDDRRACGRPCPFFGPGRRPPTRGGGGARRRG